MTDEAQWKAKLTPEQYAVLRERGTEAPFSGELLGEKRKGAYHCAACGNQLFSSDTKYDSGTGWPSFTESLPGAVRYVEDTSHGMSRVEVLCSKCGSHLGHVFDDAPEQVGAAGSAAKRFCVNSVCLAFNKDEK